MVWGALGIPLAGIAVALYIGIEIDFSLFDRSWIDTLTRLSK